MIWLSPQARAAVQRTMLPILVLLSAAIVVLGKADQLLFDSVRTAVTDTVAPVLEAVSRPLAAAGSVIDNVQMLVNTYQENARLETENARLLQWQETAAALAAFCRENNPRFNTPRWFGYIDGDNGPNGGKIQTRSAV